MFQGMALASLAGGAGGAAGAAGSAALFSNPITAGLTVGMAGLQLFSALQQQKAAKNAMNAAAMGASNQLSAIENNLQLALFENANRRGQAVGRTLTTLAANGGFGGSTDRNLLNEAVAAASLNDYYTKMDAQNKRTQVRYGYESQVASIRGSTPGLAPAAIGGAFQGFTSALALRSALKGLEQANQVGANPGRFA